MTTRSAVGMMRLRRSKSIGSNWTSHFCAHARTVTDFMASSPSRRTAVKGARLSGAVMAKNSMTPLSEGLSHAARFTQTCVFGLFSMTHRP